MLTIKIKTDNASFHDSNGLPCPGPECARILRIIEADLRAGSYAGVLMDANGNSVGTFKLTNR